MTEFHEEPTETDVQAAPSTAPAAPGEIDVAGLQATKRANTDKVGQEREAPYWTRSDAPKGSTKHSLAVVEGGRKVRVHGPTHYHHLADGRVVAGYGGGTHHSEPGDDGQDKITKILAIHEG